VEKKKWISEVRFLPALNYCRSAVIGKCPKSSDGRGRPSHTVARASPPALKPALRDGSDAVIICAGISSSYAGERIDRPFQLPEIRDELIQNLSKINPSSVAVFHIILTWVDVDLMNPSR
jgi:hypothetical protein